MIATDRPGDIALVSVDVPTPVMEQAPSTFSNIRGMLSAAITSAFAETPLRVVDRTELGYRLPIEPEAASEGRRVFGMRANRPEPADVSYAASAPQHLPQGISEPLVLGMRVIEWTLLETESAHGRSPAPTVDVVYSLWTRSGEEVDTQRVRVAWPTMTNAASALELLPSRATALDASGSDAVWSMSPGRDEAERFRQSVSLNAIAFAFPFGRHEMHHTALWDDSEPAGDSALKLAKEGKFEEALDGFERLLVQQPRLAAARFNAGVLRELRGDDEGALAHYESALELKPDERLYRNTRDAVRRRLALRRVVALPAASVPEAPGQDSAPAETARAETPSGPS